MNILSMVENLSPEAYERLLFACETGKWPEGVTLTPEQQDSVQQVVMMYQSKVLKSEQHMQVGVDGQVNFKSKQELKKQFREQEQIARFTQNDI